jgi:FkbM family methyltransferase
VKKVLKSVIASLGYEVRKIPFTPQVVASGQVVAWRKGDVTVKFYLESGFDLIGRDIFNGKFFEEAELEYLKGIVDPKGCVADIGANLGNHTIYFASVLGAEQVVAFEPGEWAHPRLTFNVALNQVGDRVQIHKVALSDTAGEAWMDFWAEDNHGTLAITDEGQGEKVEVRVGDEYFTERNVTLIKVDAERHELKVLKGLSATINRCRPVIAVEVLQTERPEMEAFLTSLGYSVVKAFERYGDIVNLIARPTATTDGAI